MINVVYYSFTRFPAEKAHALYLAKVSESFSSQSDVTFRVVVPRRFYTSKQSPKEYFRLSQDVRLVRLPSVDLFPISIFRMVAHHLGLLSFTFFVFWHALFMTKKEDYIFSNDILIAFFLTLIRKRVIYELHDFPLHKKWLYKIVFHRVEWILTNNHHKARLLHSEFSVSPEKTIAVHNGVDIDKFDIAVSRVEARRQLEVNNQEKIIAYTGHLFDWKGADILADVAKDMPEARFLFIGGTESDVKKMRNKYEGQKNIDFIGHKPHHEMPLYQKAADVLVLPNTAKSEISRLHTSPMKVFEYMASKTPIVASDIPSIKEILNEDSAVFFIPDNRQSLQQALHTVLNLSEQETNILTENAFSNVAQYQWKYRASQILSRLRR